MNKNSNFDDREADHHDEWLFGGLAALCAAALTQLGNTQAESLSCLGLGILSFAVAIPLLVFSLLVTRITSIPRTGLRYLADVLGVLFSFVGLSCLILHMNQFAGLAFITTTVIAIILYLRIIRQSR